MSEQSKKCQVAILAGGMGTRLKERTGGVPKPMAPILGRPVLEYLIDICRNNGLTEIALLVHFQHEVIRAHFGNGEQFGVSLTYCVEQDARGTAGALGDALDCMAERFVVMYGDTYADIDLSALLQSHAASGSAASLLLHPNDHPADSDLVALGQDGRVTGIHPYPHPEDSAYPNLVNAAMYVVERRYLGQFISGTGKSDLAKNTFPAMLAAGLHLHGYVTPEYIKDMGTPERLDKVERDIIKGLPERLSARQLRHAVFLDRDGTLNEEVNYLRRPEQLRLLEGAGEAVHALNRAGVLAVGITNQPVIARGELSVESLAVIHATLDNQLGAHRAYLDRMYVCPHHPDSGFDGEVAELKIRCACRKPGTGMLDQAVRELGVSRLHSWMVGDTTTDIEAGHRAGLRTILVRTGYAGKDRKSAIRADYVMPDLAAAADWILRGHAAIAQQMLTVAPHAAAARLVVLGGPARAGKTSAAQVLAEQLGAAGKTVHIFSLDGWLRPASERPEGEGVVARYDMKAVRAVLAPLLETGSRHWVAIPEYDRSTREARTGQRRTIGPQDVLIVEGVPALMDDFLVENSTVRIAVGVDESERRLRLQAEYAWRKEPAAAVDAKIASREKDELPAVRASAARANHHIEGMAPK